MPLIFDPETVPLALDAHGVARVGGTRVSLESLLALFLDGASPEAIHDSFDVLSLPDVYATLAYYLRHRAEVDAYLVERGTEEERALAEIDRRNQGDDFWARLLEPRAERARTGSPSSRTRTSTSIPPVVSRSREEDANARA